MTKEEAAYFSDVLKAYSEGRTIQIYDRDKWNDCNDIVYFDSKPKEYRIKPKYRPYRSADEFLEAQKEHGPYLERMGNPVFRIPIMVDDKNIKFDNGDIYSYLDLIEFCRWQDGTSCCCLTKY